MSDLKKQIKGWEKDLNQGRRFQERLDALEGKKREWDDQLSQESKSIKEQIDSLKKFFLNNQNLKLVTDLVVLLKIDDYKILNKNTPLSGKLIMFTGGFKDKSRSELKMLAENLGAKIVSSISKKTNFLVVGSQKPTKKKIDIAKKLNIKILSEKDWDRVIN